MTSHNEAVGCDIVYRALNDSTLSKDYRLSEKCSESVTRDLINVAKKQQTDAQSVSKNVERLESTVEGNGKTQSELIANLEKSYSNRLEDFQALQISHQEHVDGMFEIQLETINFWMVIIGAMIALASILGFLFISQYKKREINRLIDDANLKISENIKNQELVKQMVVNVFSTAEVKSKLNEIKSDIWLEVEPLIKSTIEDYISSNNGNAEQKEQDLSSITKPKEG